MKKVAAAIAILGVALAAPAMMQGAWAQDSQTGSGPPKSATVEAKPGSEDVVIAPEAKRATPPDGDPRSIGEKREQAAAYDKCLLTAKERQMYDPVGSTPEEYCSRRLGMADRDAIPNSVKTPRGN